MRFDVRRDSSRRRAPIEAERERPRGSPSARSPGDLFPPDSGHKGPDLGRQRGREGGRGSLRQIDSLPSRSSRAHQLLQIRAPGGVRICAHGGLDIGDDLHDPWRELVEAERPGVEAVTHVGHRYATGNRAKP